MNLIVRHIVVVSISSASGDVMRRAGNTWEWYLIRVVYIVRLSNKTL